MNPDKEIKRYEVVVAEPVLPPPQPQGEVIIAREPFSKLTHAYRLVGPTLRCTGDNIIQVSLAHLHLVRLDQTLAVRREYSSASKPWGHWWALTTRERALDRVKARQSLTKKCSLCGQEKPMEAFFFKKASTDGRDHNCRACARMYRKMARAGVLPPLAERSQEYWREVTS